MRRLLSVSTLVLCALADTSAQAQAWPRPPGGYYLTVRSSYFETDTEYNFRGEEAPLHAEDPSRSEVRYRELAAECYLEYGITERFTAVASVAIKNARTWEKILFIPGYPPEQAIRTNYGLSDLWLQLRTPILRRRVTVSLQYGVKIPLGYDEIPDNGGPPLGTAYVDGDFGAWVGLSLAASLYASGGGNYRVRGGEFNDELWYGFEIGGSWRAVFGKLRLEGVRSTREAVDVVGQAVQTPLPPSILNRVIVGNADSDKLIAVASLHVRPPVSIAAEAYYTYAGANTLAGTTFVVSLVAQRP